jgi:PLP dependent protein
MINIEQYTAINTWCQQQQVTLIAVSKTKPIEAVEALYNLGHRDFGENYVQELVAKEAALPKDIRWHFIGHLQSNKVKYIAPFVHLIHGVDSLKLYNEIVKQAIKLNKTVPCLLQMHIASEDTKFGFNEVEIQQLINDSNWHNSAAPVQGVMAMASFTENTTQLESEFELAASNYRKLQAIFGEPIKTLSCGMSSDYKIAVAKGSNTIRVGSSIFGARNYNN